MLSECPVCGGELVPITEKEEVIGYFCDECGSYFDNHCEKCEVII